jgi:Tfp pilus assembly protein PilF
MTDLSTARQVATELHRQGKLAEAQAAYAAYLAQKPGDSGIWSNLGALFRTNGQHDLSLHAQERAYALAPNDRGITNNLANILSDIGIYDRSIALRRKVLAADPTDAMQKAMIGKSLRAQGKYGEAIAWLEKCIPEHPEFHELKIQLALAELADRRYAKGFRTYDIRWETGELTPRKISQPKWDYGPLDGKSILVMPEQGFGDAVTFARFLPVLRRFNPARVLLFCEKPLLRLFKDVEGVDWIGNETPPGGFDVWTNMMDLPPLQFDQAPAVPAPTKLHLPDDSIARARAITAPFKGKFKVGIAWCGSVTYRGNAFRSFHHSEFLPLLDIPDLQLFSLYKGPELKAFQDDGTNSLIVDTAGTDRDFADCAATMREMDLVITSCTAICHVAGSLPVPTWTLLHWDAFWLWQHQGGETPWYPQMKLIRQSRPRDWAGVMAKVRTRLLARMADWKKERRP